MIDYCQPPLGYLVRVPQESLDSSLDTSARARAEEAARFLSFERIGQIVSVNWPAAIEAAEIISNGCSIGGEPAIDERLDDAEAVCGYLTAISSYLASAYLEHISGPCVLVIADREIRATAQKLCPANVCGEIVAPGGIISIHRHDDMLIARARHMILDFSFTDFVETVSAGT